MAMGKEVLNEENFAASIKYHCVDALRTSQHFFSHATFSYVHGLKQKGMDRDLPIGSKDPYPSRHGRECSGSVVECLT